MEKQDPGVSKSEHRTACTIRKSLVCTEMNTEFLVKKNPGIGMPIEENFCVARTVQMPAYTNPSLEGYN